MKENDIVTLTITDIGMHGEGIAKYEDITVFVPFALPDEQVIAKVLHVKDKLAYAELREVQVPSPKRVTPPCNRYTRCGGCDLLHADYAYQLQVKTAHVATTLRKMGVDCRVLPTMPSPKPLAYRNKIMLPFGVAEGRVVVGFFREGTHRIVGIKRCPLHADWAERLIDVTLSFANAFALSVYRSEEGTGLLRHLVARHLDGHLDVTLVVNAQTLPHWRRFKEMLAEAFPDFTLYVSPNTRHNNVIMGDSVCLLAGEPYVHRVMGIAVGVNPLSFLQVNDEVCHAIYRKVEDAIAPHDGSVVVDAYAGVGVLGAVLAKRGATVYNIEIVPEAVADADKLARDNGLYNVINLCGDSAVRLPEVLAEVRKKAPVVHDMRLRTPYFDAIAAGQKTYELRLSDEKRRKIKAGDIICFASEDNRYLYCRVRDILSFDNFAALFNALGTATTCLNNCSIAEAIAMMDGIYSAEEQSRYGVVALAVCPVNAEGLSVVLDPPRKGCHPAVVRALLSMAEEEQRVALCAEAWPTVTLPYVQRLLYISCNPATLARDLAQLTDGYHIDEVQPFDMFPQTAHVETLVQLSHKTPDSHIVVKVDFDKDNSI